MAEFAGWHMPLTYRGVVEEHRHTRAAVSLFDVSHMGRLVLTGADAEACLEHLCTRRMSGTEVGQCRYTHLCHEDGSILDDMIVSRDAERWLVVCNASNRQPVVDWIRKHAQGRNVELADITTSTAMIALQGPRAREECDRLLPMDVGSIGRYRFIAGTFMTFNYVIARSGYTGEDGFEIILPARAVPLVVPRLFGDRADVPTTPIRPAGLGARDTLRLEAGMPLYGHELTAEWDPLTAGQGWCVDLETDFIGAEALRRIKADGPRRRLVGLELEGRRTARHGYEVYQGGAAVGRITSGCLSPTLGKSIAMALIDAECADVGTELQVDFAGRRQACRVVKLPFYQRSAG